MLASYESYPAIVKLLIDAGADMNAKNTVISSLYTHKHKVFNHLRTSLVLRRIAVVDQEYLSL
jgi:hypothetical protein